MNEKRKTKLCNNWLDNTCKYGDDCAFAHGINDLKGVKIIKKEPPSNYKTKLCNTWTSKGYCSYGDKCMFAHGKDDLKIIEDKPKTTKLPENYKTKDCKNWKDGTCPYGDKCLFIHPETNNKEEESICYPCFNESNYKLIELFKEANTMFLVLGGGKKYFTRLSYKPDSLTERQFGIETLNEEAGCYERHSSDNWDEVKELLLNAMDTYPDTINIMPGLPRDDIYQIGGICHGFSIKNPLYSEC